MSGGFGQNQQQHSNYNRGNNNNNRGGNQRREYRNNPSNYENNQVREVTQDELIHKLSQQRNNQVENYKEFNFAASAAVDNTNQPYIFAKNEPNKITRIDESAVVSLKGTKKMEPFNLSVGVNPFFDFPSMANKGELQREKVAGFR